MKDLGFTTFEELMYKGMPVLKDEHLETATIYLRKDGKRWDMRFKENKKWAKVMFPKKPWYDKPLQDLANFLGSPIMFNSHLSYKHYLNPIKFIRHKITGVWHL